MKVERIVALLRKAVYQAKSNAKDLQLVTDDAYCVPVEIGGVSSAESNEALEIIQGDEDLMLGIRKIREYGPGKWTVEPYPQT